MSISLIEEGFKIGPFIVTNTMVFTWALMALLCIVFIWLAKGAKVVPEGKKQVVAEWLVDIIDGMVASSMGKKKMYFAPYILALFSFLLISNLSGFVFLGFVRPPTADWATTLALAVITFCMMEGFGVASQGFFGFLKSLADPIPLLFPLNVIGEIAPIVSLSFRLFGNILGGLIISSLVYSAYTSGNAFVAWTILAGILLIITMITGAFDKYLALPKKAKRYVTLVAVLCLLPILAISFVHFYFDLFAGIMQAYIFTMLTMMFVSARIPD